MDRSLIQSQLQTYKKKRDLNLFFLFGAALFTLILYIILNLLKINFNLIVSITLGLLVILTILMVYLRPKILTYSMYYKYYLMLMDALEPRRAQLKPFTQSFIDKLKNEEGLDSITNTPNFVIYYKLVDRIKEVRSKGKTLIAVVLAKHKHADFYVPELEKAFENIQSREKKYIKKQIIIQMNKYDTYDEITKENLDKIINLVDGSNVLVHINCGMMLDTKQVYFLRPQKRFPNKYYYFGTLLIERLLEI